MNDIPAFPMLKKGVVVRLTEKGKRIVSYKFRLRLGVVAHNQKKFYIPVTWEGNKSIEYYHPSFIEIVGIWKARQEKEVENG